MPECVYFTFTLFNFFSFLRSNPCRTSKIYSVLGYPYLYTVKLSFWSIHSVLKQIRFFRILRTNSLSTYGDKWNRFKFPDNFRKIQLIGTRLKNKIENNSIWEVAFYWSEGVKINSSWVLFLFQFSRVAANGDTSIWWYSVWLTQNDVDHFLEFCHGWELRLRKFFSKFILRKIFEMEDL